MVEQAPETQKTVGDAKAARRVALNDGIAYRRVTRPANDEDITPGSPWAMAPWPLLEIRKWAADCLDLFAPGRTNRALLRAAGTDPQARLRAAMHECVIPALRGARDELAAEGHDVTLAFEGMHVTLRARGFNGRAIGYSVEGAVYAEPVFSLVDLDRTSEVGRRYARIRIVSRGRSREVRLTRCSAAAMRRDALYELRNQILY